MIKELTEKHLHENEELKAIVIRRAGWMPDTLYTD